MDYDGYTSLSGDHHSRITSPTCEDLGIPRDVTYEYLGTVDTLRHRADLVGIPLTTGKGASHPLTSQNVVLHGLKFDPENPNNPFSPFSQIPLPNPFGYDYPFEPAFIRKRNERERERVRCVNDGYARLRNHLPFENREKRISKVETLRAAIKYISHLRGLLDELDSKEKDKSDEKASRKRNRDEEEDKDNKVDQVKDKVEKTDGHKVNYNDETVENENQPKAKVRKGGRSWKSK